MECANQHCKKIFKVQVGKAQDSKYCRCKGWYTVKCEECGSPTNSHCEWEHPARWCDNCKSKGIGRDAWKTKTDLEEGVGTHKRGTFYKEYPQHNLKDRDIEDHTYYDPETGRSGRRPGNDGRK